VKYQGLLRWAARCIAPSLILPLCLLFAIAPKSYAAISLVQHTFKNATGTITTSTLPFAVGNSAGNFIAVCVRAGAAGEAFTVTDTIGNTYQQAVRIDETGSGNTLAIYYAQNIAAGANTVRVTDTIAATLRFVILEYSGVATSNALDVTAAAIGNSAFPNSGSATTSANGDLLLGTVMAASGATYTAGGGYTIKERVPATNTRLVVEDQIQASAGTASASVTLGGADFWAAELAAFKAAGGGGGTPPSITSLSPTSGPVGTSVTVTGTNFGGTQGASSVTFNGTTGTPTSWSSGTITVPVPTGATSGNVVVNVNGVISNGMAFMVTSPSPTITGLSPSSGAAGTPVTITGSGFGATQGSGYVTFNGSPSTANSWSDSSIVAVVPNNGTDSTTSPFTVNTNGQTAISPPFLVYSSSQRSGAWNDQFPNVDGWRKSISPSPGIVESRADAPGLLISGSWSNLNGGKQDQDGETTDATVAAEIEPQPQCNNCYDGGTQWLTARKYAFNLPQSATVQAIAFAFRWNVDAGNGGENDCPIVTYNFGVTKNNQFIPYAYRWVWQDPYVPPPDPHFSDWWPFEDRIGYSGTGIWNSSYWVPIAPNPDGYKTALWMNNWNAADINDPGFGAGISLAQWLTCDPKNIHVDNVQTAVYFTGPGPTISGPDTVWWFNGATPANYPTEITLHSDAGLTSSWSITAGADRIALFINGTPCGNYCFGEDVQVESSGTSFSVSPDDISIAVTDGTGAVSSPFYITVRTPYQLVPTGSSNTCDMDYGYDVNLNYKIQDQLFTDLPSSIEVNEDWTTGVIYDYPGTDWERGPVRAGMTDPGSEFHDEIQGERVGRIPDAYCQGDLGPKVEHWGQIWHVGSLTAGAGVEVQTDTLQKYENDAHHENIGR
jgi:hypothetical protein